MPNEPSSIPKHLYSPGSFVNGDPVAYIVAYARGLLKCSFGAHRQSCLASLRARVPHWGQS